MSKGSRVVSMTHELYDPFAPSEMSVEGSLFSMEEMDG